MKIRYINIKKARLANKSPQKIEKLIKKAKETFPNITEDGNSFTEEDKKNAIIALDGKRIIGWINFENKQGVQKINGFKILPEYANTQIKEELIEQAISELQNERPIITLAVGIIPNFLPIIDKYNWEKTSYTITPDCIQGMYSFNEHPKEHIYKKRIDTKKLS